MPELISIPDFYQSRGVINTQMRITHSTVSFIARPVLKHQFPGKVRAKPSSPQSQATSFSWRFVSGSSVAVLCMKRGHNKSWHHSLTDLLDLSSEQSVPFARSGENHKGKDGVEPHSHSLSLQPRKRARELILPGYSRHLKKCPTVPKCSCIP